MKQTYVFILWVIMIIIVFIVINKKQKDDDIKTPIKEMVVIDSITVVNDSINKKIKELKNKKNEEVNKVIYLDNDSSIKLFKRLVRE